MKRAIPLILALSMLPVAVMFARYGLHKEKKLQDPVPPYTASPEKSSNSAASHGTLEQAVKNNREQNAPEGAPPSVLEPDSSEWHSVVQQSTPERMHTDATPTAHSDVIEARAEQANDISVLGQPFPASESIVEACKPAKAGVFRWSSCDRVNELLIEMAGEPRDELWATSTERVLRAYAEQEPGNFTIRAVECRRSICFIETASIVHGLDEPDYHFLRNHGLNREHLVVAFETDATGLRWTVTLLPFTRR